MIPARAWSIAILAATVFAASVQVVGSPALASSAAADDLPIARDARLGGDENSTRFVIDLSKRVELTAFALADPYRVVIDLPQLIFQLPPKAGEEGRGLVKAFRFGLVMPGGSRIVLDTAKPVRIDKAFVLDATAEQPARLVVDLVATDRETFMRTLKLETRPPRPLQDAKKAAVKDGDRRPLIMLDPGHGGIDHGTTAHTGETEKAIVLDFALQLRDRLEKSGKYRVDMTRSDDRFITLADRVRMARSQQAALFISIHADSLPRRGGEVRGATVYTLSETASDEEAARLADTENKADLIAGVDLREEPNEVADILIDLAQRETKSFSLHFAKNVIGELRNAARLHKPPLKSAGFRVLKAPDVPSVLIELGFVTSAQDLKLLTSEAWRGRAADSVAQAIHTFFRLRVAGERPASGAN